MRARPRLVHAELRSRADTLARRPRPPASCVTAATRKGAAPMPIPTRIIPERGPTGFEVDLMADLAGAARRRGPSLRAGAMGPAPEAPGQRRRSTSSSTATSGRRPASRDYLDDAALLRLSTPVDRRPKGRSRSASWSDLRTPRARAAGAGGWACLTSSAADAYARMPRAAQDRRGRPLRRRDRRDDGGPQRPDRRDACRTSPRPSSTGPASRPSQFAGSPRSGTGLLRHLSPEARRRGPASTSLERQRT